MGDWFFNLSVPWMALVIFLATYLIAGSVDLVVTRLAVNERAKGFKAVSPGVLPVFGILFALLVGFIAVEVWAQFRQSKGCSYDRGQRASCCRSTRRSFSRRTEDAHLCAGQPSHRGGRERRMAGDGATANDPRNFASGSD